MNIMEDLIQSALRTEMKLSFMEIFILVKLIIQRLEWLFVEIQLKTDHGVSLSSKSFKNLVNIALLSRPNKIKLLQIYSAKQKATFH